MFVYPHLASFPSLCLACFSFHLFPYLSTGLFLLSLHVHAWSTDTWSKGAASKAQEKMARMQVHKGQCSVDRGPSPSWEVLSFSLSLSLFFRACIRVPIHVPPFVFLLLACATFSGYGNVYLHFLYLAGPYPWNVGNVWFTFLTLCDSIVHDVWICIYIYIYAYIYACMCVGDCALCMMYFCGMY